MESILKKLKMDLKKVKTNRDKLQCEIEAKIAAHRISMKSDLTLISEIAFINRCLQIKERDEFLSFLFHNSVNLSEIESSQIKQSLYQVKDMLYVEYMKRRLN